MQKQCSTLNAFSNFKTFDRLKVPKQSSLQCDTNHPYSFLMILLLVLNFNCQKDDSVQQNELSGHKTINTITFEDFKKINSNTNLINGIERHADFNFAKSESGLLNRNEEEEEFIILTDEILMITDSIYNHYTFKVLMQSES